MNIVYFLNILFDSNRKKVKVMKKALIKCHPRWKKDGIYRNKTNNHLVYVSKHNGSCDKCAPWQGRVYIDDVLSYRY